MFENITSINKTSQYLDLLGKKQKVIGENIANTDTPGYTRKQLSFADYLPSGINNLESKINQKFGSSQMGIESTGQSVNMADEIVDMQKNSLMYNVAVRRMSSVLTELRTVVNVGK